MTEELVKAPLGIDVNEAPEPLKVVAVITPVTLTPEELAVIIPAPT